jgi:hypothetical protein
VAIKISSINIEEYEETPETARFNHEEKNLHHMEPIFRSKGMERLLQ